MFVSILYFLVILMFFTYCVVSISIEIVLFLAIFFFFHQKTAYEVLISDWSSDVCSSDLANSSALEADRRGFPVVRGEVVALSPSAASLAKAQSAGFAIARSEVLEALGVTLVTLRTPEGLRARDALAKLRKLDPAGSYDLNHIYIGAGQAVPVGNEDSQKPTGGRPLVGLIDRGAGRHPALDGLIVEQRGFAPGGVVQ